MKIAVSIFLAAVSLALSGQAIPDWLNDDFRRMRYPANDYFTGFAYGELPDGKTLQEITQQMKTEAQADLSRKIRMQITSGTTVETTAVSANGQYREKESLNVSTTVESAAELAGLNTESYYNPATKTVYAFATVKRSDLADYSKRAIVMNIAQVESFLQTAQNLEAAGEKSQARRQCEAADSLFAKARSTQQLLTAIDPNITPDDMQQAKIDALHNRLAQMQAHLAQAVFVYMESVESNLSRPTTVVANRLKSELSAKGCSFVNDAVQADFRVLIKAATRRYGNEYGFTVCYADVAIQLFDVRKNKTVFQDEFSQKGISTSQETAGRKALEDAVPVIANKISQWIN